MKVCCRCRINKDRSEFNRRAGRKDGLQGHCKQCQKEWYKAYYDNDPREKSRLKNKRVESLKEKREFIQQSKDIPCSDCGVEYPYYVMDFDHLRDKEFSIATSINLKSLATIKKEIEKCEVVCSNCHRIRTHNRRDKF